MVRLSLLASALLLSASGLSAQGRNIDVRLRGYEAQVRLDTFAVWTIVPARPAETFSAARMVFENMKVPLSMLDSAHGALYNTSVNTRTKIIGKRMSWALRCGDGISGDNADSYRINMAYAVFLEPTVDQQTRMGVALVAGANNVDGAFKPAVSCGSTGQFEREIAMLVKAQVQLRTP